MEYKERSEIYFVQLIFKRKREKEKEFKSSVCGDKLFSEISKIKEEKENNILESG